MRNAILVFLLILSGCGGSYWRWSKSGVSEQQARQDGFDCKQISRQSFLVGSGNMVVGGSEPDFKTWKECLEARGYSVTEQGDSDPPPPPAYTNVGNGCAPSSTTIGSVLTVENGQKKKVTALYGTSPRCADSAYPILADFQDYVASPLSTVGNACVSTIATIGSKVTVDGKPKIVKTLHGTSARCPSSSVPILASLEDEIVVPQKPPTSLNLKEIADPEERVRRWREDRGGQ